MKRRVRGAAEGDTGPAAPAEEFDFETMLSQFEGVKIGAGGETTTTHAALAAAGPEEGAGTGVAGDAGAGADDDLPEVSAGYNKATSFFDTISCDATDKAEGRSGRMRRDDERRLNTETFGAVGLSDNRCVCVCARVCVLRVALLPPSHDPRALGPAEATTDPAAHWQERVES